MTAVRWWSLVLLLGGTSGCALGLGEPCEVSTDCPEKLICAIPRGEGGDTTRGVCDYPLKQENERCTVASDCERSLTCSNHFTPGERYGTCVVRKQNGAPCFMDRDCVSGNCAGASGTALDGTCR